MPITQEELEQEIAKLSAFINRQIGRSQRLIGQVEDYLDNNDAIREAIENNRPRLKKGRLTLEMMALKLRLKFLNYQIRQKREEQSKEETAESTGKKKGGE